MDIYPADRIPVSVFTDGGCIRQNPSLIGGTYAWCAVDAQGEVVGRSSGVHPASEEEPITSNVMEFVAAVRALESLPRGWSGKLCSDSQITIGRLCHEWALNNLPRWWIERGGQVLRRLGRIEGVLLAGPPTRMELIKGYGKGGLPVSLHNVWADQRCREEAQAYLERMALAEAASVTDMKEEENVQGRR